MNGVIFMEMLRRNWRTTLYWGIGLGLYGYIIIIFIPNVDMLQQYAELMASMPPAMLQMFGVEDAATMATPEGFIGSAYFVYVVFMLAVYAVMAGLSITANEEDQGIMDVVLSLPIKRSQIIIEKSLFYLLAVVAIALLGYAGLMLGMATGSGSETALKVDSGIMLAGSINVIPITLLMIAATAFAATIFRRKNTATGVATAFIIISYLVEYLGSTATTSTAAQINNLSFFHYFDSNTVMVSGLNAGNVILLLIVTVVFAVGSLWFWQRRDVGV
ncbi:MAG: ABC transporter permease [Anaerolineae bacterium]|nr:ABC transporter permease [Anaerolineae bacterium]